MSYVCRQNMSCHHLGDATSVPCLAEAPGRPPSTPDFTTRTVYSYHQSNHHRGSHHHYSQQAIAIIELTLSLPTGDWSDSETVIRQRERHGPVLRLGQLVEDRTRTSWAKGSPWQSAVRPPLEPAQSTSTVYPPSQPSEHLPYDGATTQGVNYC